MYRGETEEAPNYSREEMKHLILRVVTKLLWDLTEVNRVPH